MATTDAIMELDVEERLFHALVNGNPEDCRELLDIIEDINVKNGSGRTLLHIAVRLGKLDWVEELLFMGSDPGIVDLSGLSVEEVAEEMSIKYPEDKSRKRILKFVSFAYKRESRGRVNAARREVTTNTNGDAEIEFRDGIQSPTLENVNLERKLSLLKDAVDELKGEQTSGGILLEKLEVSVTSLVDEWGKLEGFIERTCRSYEELKEDIKELKESRLVRNQSVGPNSKVNCVLSLMQMTSILNVGDSKLQRMKNYYDKLLSMSHIISSTLMFLQYHPEVEIMVDLDSTTISGMKDDFIGIDGTVCDGCRTNSFFDVGNMKAYAGLSEGYGMEEDEYLVPLMNVLTRVAMYIAFKNDGRPYAPGDSERQRKYRKILEEAEERHSTGKVEFDEEINRVLRGRTPRRKELMFITMVPVMICKYGMIKGTLTLCHQIPNLIKYYEEHIITTLFQESQREC